MGLIFGGGSLYVSRKAKPADRRVLLGANHYRFLDDASFLEGCVCATLVYGLDSFC